VYVPPAFAADAIMEAIDAEIGLVVVITEDHTYVYVCLYLMALCIP